MAAPLPARNVVSTQNTTRPRDAALLQIKNGNRNVSVTYGKSSVTTPPPPTANDNPRPRDAVIRQAANDNRNTSVVYKNPNSLTRGDYGPRTVSEEFDQTYNQAGLQPSVGSVTPYRNIQTQVTYNQKGSFTSDQQNNTVGRASGNASPSRDMLDFSGKKMVTTGSEMKDFQGKKMDTKGKSFQRELEPLPKKARTSLNPKKALLKKLPGGFDEGALKTVADKAFVTEATMLVAPASLMVWFTLQLPLAILSLVFMSISSALDAAEETINGNIITGTIWKIGKAIISTINDASVALFGFDFTSLAPSTFFMITDGMVMLIGWFTILIIGFVYLIFGISPVFGKGSGAKISALIMALVFYALPIFNLFPWFGIWVLAVWLYPTDD